MDGEEIETTPEHPFYLEGEGWVNAEDLQVGADLRNADGSTGEVEAIEIEQTSQEMYNLTVNEAHTFFVGDGQWLVHNADLCDPRRLPSLEQLGKSLNPRSPSEWLAIQNVVRSDYVDMGSHIPNVHNVAVAMATELGYSGARLERFSIGAFLHDIGKGDEAIVALFNSSKIYSVREKYMLEMHVWSGKNQLIELGVTDPMILQMVSWHHPDYLSMPHPKNMPEYVQILNAADVYGAMREIRSYKVDQGHIKALMRTEQLVIDGFVDRRIFDVLGKISGP